MAKQWTKSEEFWLEIAKANAIIALSEMEFEFNAVAATQMVLNAAKRLEKFTAPYKRYSWEIEIAEKGADRINDMVRQLQRFKASSEFAYNDDRSKVEVINNYNAAVEIFRDILKFATKKNVEV